MAMTITRPPSTSDSGPSSNPISRAASTSSHAPSEHSVSDSEEEWLGPFREELRYNQKERLTELMQQAEAEYRRQFNQFVARRERPNAPDGLSDAAYESTLARLDRSFEAQKQKIRRLLEEEESVLIERERGLRKLSMGGKLDSEQTAALLREQEELFNMYQAKAHHSESVNMNNSETVPLPSTSPQQRTWVPPARLISSQKSNASTATSVSRTKRGSTVPQTNSILTEDLFPKQAQHESHSARHTSWEVDSSFRSEIHEEPEEMSDSEMYSDGERSTDDGGEEGEEVSQKDDSNADDAYYILPGFMRSPESSFSAVPTKSAPLAIARGGAHQPSSRGQSRASRRTPPTATVSYAANTTPVRHQSQNQCLSRNNSDAQHRLWKPSREEIRPPLNRRPSILGAGNREQERIREPERSWTEFDDSRTRSSTCPAGGSPSTSVSPPTQGVISSSFGASSAAAFAQNQRPTDASARIWKPPENKASMPTTSNIHVMASGNVVSNSIPPTMPSSSSALPAANVRSFRRRNDSNTSAGSPAKRPSQQQTQTFIQPMPSPKPSLPISTAGINVSRRSPVHASDTFATSSSPPIASPSLSAASVRHSPFRPRPSSPSALSASVGVPGTSLSRQPTEIIEPTSIRQEGRANKLLPRASLKSRVVEDLPDSVSPSTPPSSASFGEHMRSSPSISALSEHMAKARGRGADQDLEKREELIARQSEELRLRDAQYRKRDVELSSRVQTYDIEIAEQQRRKFEEQQRKLREELLEAQRVAQEKLVRELREELAATQRVREAEFADQKRILEELRQREAELRMQKECELAEKEEELDQHKREMEERLRLRGEREIAEQTRQLEQLKKKEASLEEQQRLLEDQRQLELAEQRKREEELRQKVEELKCQQRELMEAQRKKEEREREEALKRQEEEALIAEQRRKEDELRAQEDELKQKKLELLQREEALVRRRKEEELRAKEEALERQRKELQQREEELARREEEEERRKDEEQARKEAALRRQQEEDDKKRLEEHMQRKLAQEREYEEEDRRQRERQREREERERDRREKEESKERERRMQREREEQRRMQEEYEQRTRNIERRRQEEEGRIEGEDIKEQAELLHFFEQRKAQEEARKRDPRGVSSSTSFSPSIPNPSSSFSPAPGTFPSGRATSSASSIHSNWSGSQRSSASSASSASDFSRASTGSSATSAWSSSTRPTTASSGSAGSNRTATMGESHKPPRGAWKSSSSGGTAAGPTPSGAGAGSYTNTSPLSEAEWRRRQEEHARKQQEQFRRDSLRSEQERLAQSAAAALSSPSGREQIQQAWARYETAWATLKERPILYFQSMPWPVLRQPSTPEDLTTNAIGAFVLSPAHSIDKSARDRLKEQLLRWHPDRFESKWISKVDAKDKENVLLGAGQVARGLNELLSREALDPFG